MPREPPMLSVVIPNYNHARYLPHAILALRSQERPAEEIIVVDDGSADDSLAVLNELARDHGDLTIIRNERNRGDFSNAIVQSSAPEDSRIP